MYSQGDPEWVTASFKTPSPSLTFPRNMIREMPMSVLAKGAAALLMVAMAGCQMSEPEFGGSGGTAGFGGSGGSGGSGGFGGSGGSSTSSIALARDVCTRTLREQGRILVRIDSAREYQISGQTQGVEVRMTTRRDSLTASTEPRVCRFRYAGGTADISRT
jgi:hypothetical protein